MKTTMSATWIAALAACSLPALASAQDAGSCALEGKFFVTAYGHADNDPAHSDQIATDGHATGRPYRAYLSTSNSYDDPSTLAVNGSLLAGAGDLQEGDMVLIEDLGWFRVEDYCGACTSNWVDVWTGFAVNDAPYYEQNNLTACRNVWIYDHDETPPAEHLSQTAGSEWNASAWSGRVRQRLSGAGTQQIVVDDLLAPRAAPNWSALLVDSMEAQEASSVTFTNVYDSQPSFVYWGSYSTGTSGLWEARTKCSTFVTALLDRAYDIDSTYMTNWMGTTSPFADEYYGRIEAQDNFTRITNVADIRRGDYIAMRYTGASATGHIAIVESTPVARTASSPVISGTVQYEVLVMDSTSSAHGTSGDTRLTVHTEGVGRGTMRLYASSSTGALVGYTWSLLNGTYYGAGGDTSREVIAGRFLNLPDYE